MPTIRTQSARYRIEPDLRIGWTSPNWDRFARENGAPELVGGAVLGHSLLDFVQGAETRALYDSILRRVRETGIEVDLAFRCDSPDARRFMLLHVSRPENGQLMLTAELLREEPRARVGLLDSAATREGDPVGICSFCKRVESRGGAWVEVEQAEIELGLVEGSSLPPLDHIVCPDCKAAAEKVAQG
jgi:hypothetical protein